MDKAVARVLAAKFRLGLFENPYVDPDYTERATNGEEHRKLALDAARKAIVLLKNDKDLLPLDLSKLKTIAVIGPNAADVHLGGYSRDPGHGVSVLDGIRARVGNKATVLYAEGCKITNAPPGYLGSDANNVQLIDPATQTASIQAAVEAARKADVAILVVGAFVAGLRWKYVAAIMVMAVVVAPVGWHFLKDYQKARLVSFMDPERDPQGNGYQLIQSQIAVGAGGMFGKGVTKGTQTQLRFLPVPHKDFIFSAFAEEHGFAGVVVLLALFFVLIMRIVQNAQTAPDRAGMYICMGVAGLLLFHVLVNVGMVVGRMPVTGIPLPFMSAGGSSVWSNFLALGLVNNVRLRTFIN